MPNRKAKSSFQWNKITDLQKTPFKSADVSYVILKKITSSLLLTFLLSAFPLFAKSNIYGNEDNSKIIISGDVSIFESEDLLNDKNLNKDSKEIAKQQAVIFVSEGVSIYNIEAFNKVVIRKLEKVKKSSNQKKVSKKVSIVHTKTRDIKTETHRTYYNSTQNSESFSQNQKEKIVFSQNTNQSFSKSIFLIIKKTDRRLHFVATQNYTYKEPIIRNCHFSGKYSIRPPTLTPKYTILKFN